MPLPRLCNHEIAEADFPPILVADDGNDEDEDEEEDEEERRRDEEEEEEEPIWTAPPSGRESCSSTPAGAERGSNAQSFLTIASPNAFVERRAGCYGFQR